jgi:membrane protease YdiL (CAAX protease family)
MDQIIFGQEGPVTEQSGKSFRYLCETIFLFASGLAIPYASSYLAIYLNWPVSRALVLDGRWIFNSWHDFPLLDCLGMLIGMIAVPVIWEQHKEHKLREIGFVIPSRWGIFMAMTLVTAFVFTFVTRGPALFEHREWSLARMTFFTTYFACVSMAEETMFRGILQRRIRNMYNSLIAVGISSILFVLWHGLPASLQQGFFRITGAVILGVLYDRSRSIHPCVTLHWLINLGQTC